MAIRPTGNVYSYDAIKELNLKSKNFKDLINGEPFVKADIITLQVRVPVFVMSTDPAANTSTLGPQ